MEEGGREKKKKALLESQLSEVREACGSLISDLVVQEEDGMVSLTFKLKKEGEDAMMTLMLPEEFPGGEYVLTEPDGEIKVFTAQGASKKKKDKKNKKKVSQGESAVTPCQLLQVFQQLCAECKGGEGRKRRRLADSVGSELSGSEDDSLSLSASGRSGLRDSKDAVDELEDAEESEHFKELQAAVAEAERMHAGFSSIKVEKLAWEALVRVFFEASLFVGRQEAEVLGVAYDKYLVVEFSFSSPYYLSAKTPGVRVYQASSSTRPIPETFGLQWQLENRLKEFLRGGGNMDRMDLKKRDAPRKLDVYAEKMGSPSPIKATTSSSQDQEQVSESAARQLVGMGFDTPLVFAALRHEKNNVERAMELLLQGDSLHRILEHQLNEGLPLDFGAPEDYDKPSSTHSSISRERKEDKEFVSLGIEMGFEETIVRECIEQLQKELGSLSMSDLPTLLDRLTSFKPSFKLSEIESSNFIVKALKYVDFCLRTCTSRCVICDCDLEFEGLKPTVCSSSLCIYSYESYGLGVDVAAEVRMHPEVVDLLITLTVAGANGPRRDDFFNPYPFGVEAKLRDGNTLTFSPPSSPSSKDFSVLCNVLDKLPSVLEMKEIAIDNKTLKKNLDDIDPLLFPLLRWILTSNRCHLRKLEPKQQISALRTPYQFVLMSAPVAKERRFQELKRRHGSFWAFHGSPIANWHSIMRAGLQNLSNTSKQLHGAVNGSGIYLAPNSGLSMGYMGWGKGWSKSLLGESSNLGMMALCEVINYEDRKNKHGSHYKGNYVVPQEDHVTTRFFLIWTESGGQRGDFYATPAQFVDVQANDLHIPSSTLL